MIQNHIELLSNDIPKVLVTWHMPREDGHYHQVAFQFADDVDEEMQHEIVKIALQPLKVPAKQHRLARFGSSDHFSVLDRPLGRLGFRTRVFGSASFTHVLADRPVVVPLTE